MIPFHILFKKTAKKYLILHFSAVIIFALLYWFGDLFLAQYPIFSKKYLNCTECKKTDSLFYYIFYSLITQTTIGYGGTIDPKGQSIPFIKMSRPFQVINIIQIISVFIIPIFALM